MKKMGNNNNIKFNGSAKAKKKFNIKEYKDIEIIPNKPYS
jgi:hypothetical protein